MNEIYLDLDETLNRFTSHELSRRLGRPFLDAEYPVDFGWNIVGVYNLLSGLEPITNEQFWRTVPRESWASAPLSEIYQELIDWSASRVGRENVFILTATPGFGNPDVYAGKADWMLERLPHWIHENVFFGRHKSRLAAPGRLLVDDANHNVDAWQVAGGDALMVPRPWNRLHGIPTHEYVTTALKFR